MPKLNKLLDELKTEIDLNRCQCDCNSKTIGNVFNVIDNIQNQLKDECESK